MMIHSAAVNRQQLIGLSPGTMGNAESAQAAPTRIDVIVFDPHTATSHDDVSVDAVAACLSPGGTAWIQVSGLRDTNALRSLGQQFGVHHLVMEDIVRTDQRAKVELFDDHVFLVARMARLETETAHLAIDQISIVMTAQAVIVFEERPTPFFDPLRDRVLSGRGRVRQSGVDYLTYALLDIVVDHGFVILEQLSSFLDEQEEQILDEGNHSVVSRIHVLRRQLIFVRKTMWPLRDAVATLSRFEHPLMRPDTAPYWRDLHDHLTREIETVEALRELASGLLDIHLSATSNRMNEIMQVLTMIATIFIPITFIAGIYGMNFERMPELSWPWAYPAVLALCLGIGLSMMWWFRRRGWW